MQAQRDPSEDGECEQQPNEISGEHGKVVLAWMIANIHIARR